MKLKIKKSEHLKLVKALVYSGYGVTTVFGDEYNEVTVWEWINKNKHKEEKYNE